MGHVNVRVNLPAEVLDATLVMGWGGVGWGMLTFV